MVAGGIGQTPMLLLGTEALGTQKFGPSDRANGWSQQVTLIYGARRKSLLAGIEDFRQAGFNTELCTDDGSEVKRNLFLKCFEKSFPPFQAIQRCGW